MQWTQERLYRLNEINQARKINRYFAIKHFVEKIVGEEILLRKNRKEDKGRE